MWYELTFDAERIEQIVLAVNFASELVECHLCIPAFSFLLKQVLAELNSGLCVLVLLLRVANLIGLALRDCGCCGVAYFV